MKDAFENLFAFAIPLSARTHVRGYANIFVAADVSPRTFSALGGSVVQCAKFSLERIHSPACSVRGLNCSYMKTIIAFAFVLACLTLPASAAESIKEKLQKGFFEEEANQNIDGAIQAYQSILTQFDEERKIAA